MESFGEVSATIAEQFLVDIELFSGFRPNNEGNKFGPQDPGKRLTAYSK